MPRHGVAQGDEHRVRGPPRIHLIERPAPPREQAQAFRPVSDFVAKVVRPAAVGIHVEEILVQPLGKQKARHVKVFVVMGGQPARVSLRFAGGIYFAERFRGADELGWRELYCAGVHVDPPRLNPARSEEI